jgi:hypothetical protein
MLGGLLDVVLNTIVNRNGTDLGINLKENILTLRVKIFRNVVVT